VIERFSKKKQTKLPKNLLAKGDRVEKCIDKKIDEQG